MPLSPAQLRAEKARQQKIRRRVQKNGPWEIFFPIADLVDHAQNMKLKVPSSITFLNFNPFVYLDDLITWTRNNMDFNFNGISDADRKVLVKAWWTCLHRLCFKDSSKYKPLEKKCPIILHPENLCEEDGETFASTVYYKLNANSEDGVIIMSRLPKKMIFYPRSFDSMFVLVGTIAHEVAHEIDYHFYCNPAGHEGTYPRVKEGIFERLRMLNLNVDER